MMIGLFCAAVLVGMGILIYLVPEPVRVTAIDPDFAAYTEGADYRG
jgi:hypothetical protein